MNDNDATNPASRSDEPTNLNPENRSEAQQPDPFAVLEKLTAENAELKDRNLRTLAEMENLRRRTEKEIADSRIYGVTNFARDMLTFADNLQRAIASVPAEARANADGQLKAFIEGIELTERDFLSRLAKYGVKKIEPQGQKFDPNMHEALFEMPDPSVPAGTVVQVMEAGYSIGDRCLRPAKVGVARGGPKAAAETVSQAN
ncbi:nucleotide exchange factor GrpE [Roseiarcaceae bacterium H3SJ34-1]|uniref:nucleotide exchange factor GrpE n=1 Tax=Terripilifer ovatus TaxID=3032367 RepID=UPI003AB99CA8|nr:nucleotide exchange factor GrpE [Roseiarcaceae bacterium H3SJ34-1]